MYAIAPTHVMHSANWSQLGLFCSLDCVCQWRCLTRSHRVGRLCFAHESHCLRQMSVWRCCKRYARLHSTTPSFPPIRPFPAPENLAFYGGMNECCFCPLLWHERSTGFTTTNLTESGAPLGYQASKPRMLPLKISRSFVPGYGMSCL
jgi:hypothetical protein